MQGKYAHPLMPYGVLVALLFVVLWIASQVLYANVTAFTEEVPMLTEKLNEKVVWFEGISVMGYSFDISGLTELFSVETINEYIGDFVGSLASFTTRAATVLIFLLFIILEAETLPRRLKAAFPEDAARIEGITSNAGEGINTYVVTRATVAFGQAVIAGIVLWYLGVPGWFMWASITFMMDFIPYVGALISLIPPIFIGLIMLSGPQAIALILVLVVNQAGLGRRGRASASRTEARHLPYRAPSPSGILGLGVGHHGDGPRRASGRHHEDRSGVRPEDSGRLRCCCHKTRSP